MLACNHTKLTFTFYRQRQCLLPQGLLICIIPVLIAFYFVNMVKTRSDVKGIRVSGKAPRKMPNASSGSPSGRSTKKYNGHNSYCPREVPPWQKEITSFFAPNMNSPLPSDQVPSSSGETSFAPTDE